MRRLVLSSVIAAAMLALAGCGTYCPTDFHGLDEPGWGSPIPRPHG
jgi:predicted small lipoprotein YifL